MFNKHDITRDECMLVRGQTKCGYDWWWHSFTGRHAQTGEEKPFFIEFFVCNPASGTDNPVFGQLPENKEKGIKPSYLMVKAGSWGEDAAQLHRFWGWNKMELQMKAPFSVKADDCYLDETKTMGSVKVLPEEAEAHPEYMCQAGEMSWDLKIAMDMQIRTGERISLPHGYGYHPIT